MKAGVFKFGADGASRNSAEEAQNINEGAENMDSASAQTEGIFVPSKEWQDVPDWADPLPPCGQYRNNFDTNRRQARWDNPPGPETVFDKRTGKPQTVGASQKTAQNGNGSQASAETNNKPHEWLRPGKTLVVDGKPIIPTEEQRQKYNNWCNENCDKPGFNYAVAADSMGLEVRDRNEYISLGMQGKLDAAKLREFVAKCSDDLPEIESLEELEEDENIREPEENIVGLLHKGSKMVIGGPSKAKKTWLLMDLAQSISTGTKWLDVFETKQGRVLYVNLEIHKPFARKRMLAIKKAKGITKTNDNLDMLNLRGHAAPAEELIPKIMRKARRRNYSAIIIDPTYKVLGDRDENSAGDITDMLNEFEKLAAKLSVSVIFVDHFAKGNSNKKEVIDRISGSGVFARDPDTIMMMTEVEKSRKKSKKPKSDNKEPKFK